jgi:hypothetical protein
MQWLSASNASDRSDRNVQLPGIVLLHAGALHTADRAGVPSEAIRTAVQPFLSVAGPADNQIPPNPLEPQNATLTPQYLQGYRQLDSRIVPDERWPGMYRIRYLDGSLSDMVNLTRAKEALLSCPNLPPAFRPRHLARDGTPTFFPWVPSDLIIEALVLWRK